MSISKDLIPTFPTKEQFVHKEQIIMAIAGAFNLSEMHLMAGMIKETLLINNALKKILSSAAESFYQNNSSKLADDLCKRGIISDKEAVFRLVTGRDSETSKENKEKIKAPYPIVGIVGQGNSGKGTVGKILGENHDSLHLPLSNRLREVAVALGEYPPFSLEFLRSIDAKIKPNFGKETFVRWTLDRARRMSKNLHMPEVVSVDGFRSVKETEWFLGQPNTMLVAVETDTNLRFERGVQRDREGEDSSSFDEFEKTNLIEENWFETDSVISLAEHTFDNNGSLEELEEQILSYFAKKHLDQESKEF